MQPFETVQAALDRAFVEKGEDATVLVMPFGGSTLPVVSENEEINCLQHRDGILQIGLALLIDKEIDRILRQLLEETDHPRNLRQLGHTRLQNGGQYLPIHLLVAKYLLEIRHCRNLGWYRQRNYRFTSCMGRTWQKNKNYESAP